MGKTLLRLSLVCEALIYRVHRAIAFAIAQLSCRIGLSLDTSDLVYLVSKLLCMFSCVRVVCACIGKPKGSYRCHWLVFLCPIYALPINCLRLLIK